MNPQHSPAPWSIRGSTLYAANGDRIAVMQAGGSVTIAQDDANRRLIESTPELRASLEDLLWMVGPNNANEIVVQARALLAKLEGSP